MNNQTFEEFYLKYRKISRGYAYGVLHDWSAADYEILIQVKYLEISVETVAEEYGLTKSGVNNRIYKAKRWLQEEFRKVYE